MDQMTARAAHHRPIRCDLEMATILVDRGWFNMTEAQAREVLAEAGVRLSQTSGDVALWIELADDRRPVVAPYLDALRDESRRNSARVNRSRR
jgi:hypothetical protein